VGQYWGMKIVGTYGGAYGGPRCGAVRWGGTVGRYVGGYEIHNVSTGILIKNRRI